MNVNRATPWVALAALLLGAAACSAPKPTLDGTWDATVIVGNNNLEVPFKFEVVGEGPTLAASLFNGERKITSTAAAVEGDKVSFTFGQYGSKVEATLADGTLTGEYQRAQGKPYPFKAVPAAPRTPATGNVPSIEGTWVISARSNKGEKAWRFIAKQKGDEVEATILRIDGDTGTLTGHYQDGRFVLSHFSGARPTLVEVTAEADGTLKLTQNKTSELVGQRESAEALAAIGEPSEPGNFTTVKDPNEPLRFSFPDLTGKIVSNTDPQFAGKVVLVNIGGSWCPNCHDEMPFMASLYKKYHAQGLEIVLLSFEEEGQQKNPVRLREFIKTYGVEWTVLIPGAPDQLNEKMPQGVNLNAFPTTFVLGRNGKVRAVHTGFPSPGSGEFYTKAEHEMTELVERLLDEPAVSSN